VPLEERLDGLGAVAVISSVFSIVSIFALSASPLSTAGAGRDA
jgi:hypothetical protein